MPRINKVSVTARKSGPAKTDKLRYVRIECADNGCIVEADYENPMSAKEGPYMPPKSERNVFTDPKEAGAYVSKLLGGGKKEDPKHEAGESASYENDEEAGKGKAGEEEAAEEEG